MNEPCIEQGDCPFLKYDSNELERYKLNLL